MSYLIIAAVVLMVVAPIFWFMPSPEVRRQVKLRDKAMALGLQVQVCDLPQTYKAKVRQEYIEKGVVYRLPWLQAKRSVGSFHYQWVANDTQEQALPEWLSPLLAATHAMMPADIIAVEYATPGVAIYWREKGEVDKVAQVHSCLQSLQQQISEHSPRQLAE